MAYKIKLGSFSKLENSTAQPTVTSWAEYDITLKEGCDISNPEITLSIDWATVSGYNYAKLLDRYYWIVGKNMLRENLCVLQLKVDVLATYKTEIGAATLYVLRSAAAANGDIRDEFYPITANTQVGISYQTAGTIPGDFSTGVYVINVPGTDMGTTTLYQLLPSDFKTLIRNLYTAIDGFQLSDVVAEVVKRWGGNPQSLINSAMWFPYSFAGTSTNDITIGSWHSGIGGNRIEDPLLTLSTINYTVYKHPQAAARGDYLNMPPYARYELCIPGCGVITLDNAKLLGETGIRIYRKIDALSGMMIVTVTGDPGSQVIAYLTGQIGIPVTMRSGNSGIIETGISAIAETAVAMVTERAAAIAGAITAGIGAISNAHGGVPTSSNMSAGCAGIQNETGWFQDTFHYVTDADNTEHGRPLCENRQISTLSGFNQVSEGYVAIPGPLPEMEQVKALLEGGFFYE